MVSKRSEQITPALMIDEPALLADLAKRLEAENTARVEAERKAAEYDKEIERLTRLVRISDGAIVGEETR